MVSYTNQEFTIKEENTTDIKTITKTNISPKQKRRSFEKSPKFKSKEEIDNYIEKTKEDVKELDASKQQSHNLPNLSEIIKVTSKNIDKVTSKNVDTIISYLDNTIKEKIECTNKNNDTASNIKIKKYMDKLMSDRLNENKKYNQQLDYIFNNTKTTNEEINKEIREITINRFKENKRTLKKLDSIHNKLIPPKPTQTTTMQNKYGLTGTANWITLNSAMWAYPNDKRKSATVPIHIDCANGSKVCYMLHRGKATTKDEGYGQLTTTHCRVINAVINLWQQQGCKLSGLPGSCAIVECTIADVIHLLNVKNNGRTYKRIQKHISDLAVLPMFMTNENDITINHSFNYSLLYSIKEKADNGYEMLIHPFITRQLVGRKAIIRDSNICKINNPIAIKLLLLLDNRLAAGHKIVMPLDELSKELELDKDMYNNLRNIKRAITNFKDIKVHNRAIDMELSKDNRNKWQLIAKLKPLKFEAPKSFLPLLLKTKRI